MGFYQFSRGGGGAIEDFLRILKGRGTIHSYGGAAIEDFSKDP